MTTHEINTSDLNSCVNDAQQGRVIVTRSGIPVAVIIGLDDLDAEQRQLSYDFEFWNLIKQRRTQSTISRADLEKAIADAE